MYSWGVSLFEMLFGSGSTRDVYVKMQARSGETEVVIRSLFDGVIGVGVGAVARPGAASLRRRWTLLGVNCSLPNGGGPSSFAVSGDRLRVLMVFCRASLKTPQEQEG